MAGSSVLRRSIPLSAALTPCCHTDDWRLRTLLLTWVRIRLFGIYLKEHQCNFRSLADKAQHEDTLTCTVQDKVTHTGWHLFYLIVCCADEASELLPGGLNVLGAWTYIAQQDDLQPAAERLSRLTYKELAAQNTVPPCNHILSRLRSALAQSTEGAILPFGSRRHQCLRRSSRQRR